ncbi:PTS sugar transporter subunit IIA [uncultured Nocardioides sp.]|uniref:PTS sugar transporter subunit IIA n=1 Tax=uncultured Nocardioides sp. TaxID=198441 RepID=UPI00261EDB1F|nr:PTS sugar transporter subunit IIA [uncultured Nocardioides sp.]
MSSLFGRRRKTHPEPTPAPAAPEHPPLDESSVVLTGTARDREGAVAEAGALLVASGSVTGAYVEAMAERERSVSTYMGNGLALPHGTAASGQAVNRVGLSFVRYDEPLDWDGQSVRFVVGLAGSGTEHLGLIERLAGVFTDDALVERLRTATTPADVVAVLGTTA